MTLSWKIIWVKFIRRATLALGLIITGVACIVTGLVLEDPPYIRNAFSLFGKYFLSVVIATRSLLL